MNRITRTFVAATIGGVLGIATAELVQAQELTEGQVRYCQDAGTFAQAAAIDRDAGYTPLDIANSVMRQALEMGFGVGNNVTHYQLVIVDSVFKAPHMDPIDERDFVYHECIAGLNEMTQPAPAPQGLNTSTTMHW